jgi:hypothetical protein
MSGTTDSYNNYDILGNNNNSNNSDLASVHSGGSYHTNGSWNGNMHDDEFTYDSGDMLSSWEISGRWNDMISRSMNNISGGETQLLHASNHYESTNGEKHQQNDDYLLENHLNDSNIFHHWDDFTVKVEPHSHKHHSHDSKHQQDKHRSHNVHHHHHNHHSKGHSLNYDDLLLSQLFNKSCGIASSTDPFSLSSSNVSYDQSPGGKQLQQQPENEHSSSYHYQYVSFLLFILFAHF